MKERDAVKMPQQSEKDLQVDIVMHLSLLGYVCFEFARSGGRPKCPKCGTWVGRLAGATPKGWPDILVIGPTWGASRFTFLEVKTATGKIEPDQELLHAELRDMGCRINVVRSIEDAEKAVLTITEKGDNRELPV